MKHSLHSNAKILALIIFLFVTKAQAQTYSLGTTSTGSLIGNTGTESTCDCPTGYVAVGYTGGSAAWMDRFQLICAKLNSDGTIGTSLSYATAVGAVPGASNDHNTISNIVMAANYALTGFYGTTIKYPSFDTYMGSLDGLLTPITSIASSNTNNSFYLTNFGPIGSSLGTVSVPLGNVIVGVIGESIANAGTQNSYVGGIKLRYAPIVKSTTLTPAITSFTPANGSVGTLVTISGSNLGNLTVIKIGGISAIPISNTGTSLVAMVMPGAVSGAVSLTTTLGTSVAVNNFTVVSSSYPSLQQGNKMIGTGAVGNAHQGNAVAISADGNTAVVGGNYDNSQQGAVWIYARSKGVWTQQGTKLTVTGGGRLDKLLGNSVGISADGNTIIVGAYWDSPTGGTYIFTRSGSTWSQQGGELIGSGATGISSQGSSVALSADGNTAIIGGQYDNNGVGAVWFFSRNGNNWSQVGNKLVGNGCIGTSSQGASVSLSADGLTAIVGGVSDNSNFGASWIYTNVSGVWSQQGAKLVGTGSVGSNIYQGCSVSISADGNTAVVGGNGDNNSKGATWIYTRIGSLWYQQGSKLVANDAMVGSTAQGSAVSINANGNTVIIGGNGDVSNGVSNDGASWVFKLSGSTWSQKGSKLVGSGGISPWQGDAIALSADASTAIIGGRVDNGQVGAVWFFNTSINVPVKIVDFNVLGKGNQTQLDWNTENEENLSSYNIQHSTDGASFTNIGTVNAIGKGANTYQFTHNNPNDGINYYRLQSIDNNGSISYSQVVSCHLSIINSQLSIYPNPAKDKITVNSNHIASIQVVNNFGRIVNTLSLKDATNPIITIAKLTSGIYHLRVQKTDGNVCIVEFIKE